ncbi:MAG: alkaline phosphatase family protein [Bacteroidales bacterium]|nr:alkaline phosphatase family protein [Bacteroidales bacterium]
MKITLKTWAAALALLCTGATAMAQTVQPARPRLVVGIVVDQMRWDYMYYYGQRYDGGGFARLLGEGFACQNTMVDYVPTVTACGHSTIFTGATPASSGIAGNSYHIGGKPVSSVQDDSEAGVGTTSSLGRRSPRNLLVTTVGDELRLATDFKSKVVGVSLKDRAAILPSGHAANAAYWYDKSVPAFVTSTYYMQQLPSWVTRFNRSHATLLRSDLWGSWRGVTASFDMALAAVDGEQLGQAADRTDMLTLSVSTTDMSAHVYGTRSPRVDSCYLELDRQLARLLGQLDLKVGRGNYLVFLTADHGGTNNEKYSSAHKLPGRQLDMWGMIKPVNRALKAQFGVDSLITEVNEYSIYVNNEAIARHSLDRQAVVAAAMQCFESQEGIDRMVDLDNVAAASIPQPLKERLIRGYYPKRSGQLYAIPLPGYYAGSGGDGSNHGTPSADDTHIPLVFMGWGIAHGETFARTGMVDIAPTVCALLHIQMPSGCMGTAITAITQ